MERLPHLRNAWPEMAASQSVIPTFPVSQLVCPAWFSFLSLLPSGIWPTLRPAKSVGQQAFAISNASSNTAVTATGTGWLQDTTELIASPGNSHFAFVVLIIWLAGVLVLTGVYWGGNWRLHTVKQFATDPSHQIRKRFDECQRRLGLNKISNCGSPDSLPLRSTSGGRSHSWFFPKTASTDYRNPS